MIANIPRISVLIITYKQETLIKRALDSLIKQKDYLYEICVSDDCSPDNTWQVLLDYQKQYPGFFKLNRNESNVGIFENTEKTWTMPRGDVIYTMAGDDQCADGWFKRVVEFFLTNGVDWRNELFCIYGDFQAIYPSGDTLVFHQNAIKKFPNEALRLALRGIICGRGCCFSINVLKRFEKVSAGRSHKAEHIQDRLLQIYTEKNYYIPQLSNIYYTGIGVSTQIQDEDIYKDRLEIWPYTIKYLNSKGIGLYKKDIYYAHYNVAMKKFQYKHTVVGFFKCIYYFLSSIDFRLPQGNGVRHLCFSFFRRLPHKKPIYYR